MALLSIFKKWKETIADKNGDHIPIARWTRSEMVDRENGKTVEQSLIDTEDLIQSLSNRLNTLADSDDVTLDQMSELVAYIKSNRSLIENVTTNKVNVTDVIDNLTSTASSKPLSANQGKILKELIDSLSSTLPQFNDAITAANTLQVPSIGGGAVIATGTDLNTLIEPGTYSSESSAKSTTILNAPLTTSGFSLYVLHTYQSGNTNGYRQQIVITGSELYMWWRLRDNNGQWSEWQQMKFTDTTYANMTAATASAAGKAGLVPAPTAGAQTKYLRGDGTWQTPNIILGTSDPGIIGGMWLEEV